VDDSLPSLVYYGCQRERWKEAPSEIDNGGDSMGSENSGQQHGISGNRANGNGARGQTSDRCPVTGKRLFTTKVEAEQFEAEHRIRFGRQYAYKCEHCPAYHLTSKPPDAYAIQKTNLKRLENLATSEVSITGSANRRGRGETETEVKRLWGQGLRDAEIASQLGITARAVHYHRKKFGGANSGANGKSPLREPKQPLTMPEYDEQRRLLDEEYHANLRMLEQHKQRLEEASKLTVADCDDGKSVFIKFGHHERLVIPKDKVEELTNSLMQWV
jgi:hypothetical protein